MSTSTAGALRLKALGNETSRTAISTWVFPPSWLPSSVQRLILDQAAVKHYSDAIQSRNKPDPLLYSNRAMAYIKLKQYVKLPRILLRDAALKLEIQIRSRGEGLLDRA